MKKFIFTLKGTNGKIKKIRANSLIGAIEEAERAENGFRYEECLRVDRNTAQPTQSAPNGAPVGPCLDKWKTYAVRRFIVYNIWRDYKTMERFSFETFCAEWGNPETIGFDAFGVALWFFPEFRKLEEFLRLFGIFKSEEFYLKSEKELREKFAELLRNELKEGKFWFDGMIETLRRE